MTRLDPTISQVDWRQMQRWHIPESRVPADTEVMYRLFPEENSLQRPRIGGTIAVASLLVAVGGYVIVRRLRPRSLQRALRAGGSLARFLQAQDEERSRLATTLHDDLSQQAAVLAMELDRAMQDRADTRRLVRDARSRATVIADTARGLSQHLHPAKLKIIGLVGALMELPRDFSPCGIAITVTTGNVGAKLDHDVALCIFRVAQEGIQNAIAHGGGRHVLVNLSSVGEMLTLTVTDDGIGFDPGTRFGRGLGLLTMNERVAALGGTLSVVSRPGAGTHLRVAVPFDHKHRHVPHLAS